MAANKRTGSRPGKLQHAAERTDRPVGSAVTAAINEGYVIGREVLVGSVPGIVVGYNIASFGDFIGNAYPLVVRTALGVAKCAPQELTLV